MAVKSVEAVMSESCSNFVRLPQVSDSPIAPESSGRSVLLPAAADYKNIRIFKYHVRAFFQPLSVHGGTLAFLLDDHGLYGTIEGLNHLLPLWPMQNGLAECDQSGTLPRPGIEPGPQRG